MSIDINKCAFTSQDNCCQWHIAQDFLERAEQDQRWMPCKCSKVILISFTCGKSFDELSGILFLYVVCLHRDKRMGFETVLRSLGLIRYENRNLASIEIEFPIGSS